MEKLPVPTMSFEEKFRDRVKEIIGELISDDDIKKILEAGIQDALFKERKDHTKSSQWWGGHTKPSIVDELVEKHLRTQVQVVVNNWFKSHKKKMADIVANVVQEGAGLAVIKAVQNRVGPALQELTDNLRNRGII